MKSAWSRLLQILVLLLSIATSGCEIALRHNSERIEAIAQDLESVDFSTPAQTQFAVANAANSPKAVMFVHLDWTMELPSVRIQFVDFMISYAEQFPGEDVSFHYIDFTPDSSYKTLKSLPGWQEMERPHYSLVNGEHELVWMLNGQVLKVEPIHSFPTTSELITTTRSIFKNNEKNIASEN